MPARQPTRVAATAKPMLPSTLSEALELVAAIATMRAAEGKQLYTHAADMLDEHHSSDEIKALPVHIKKAFKAFSEDIALVAKRHFDAYIRGNPRLPAPYMVDPNTPATPLDSVPKLPPNCPARRHSHSRYTPIHKPADNICQGCSVTTLYPQNMLYQTRFYTAKAKRSCQTR